MAFRLPRIKVRYDGYYGGVGFRTSPTYWKPGSEPRSKPATKPRKYRHVRLRRAKRKYRDDESSGAVVALAVLIATTGFVAFVWIVALFKHFFGS